MPFCEGKAAVYLIEVDSWEVAFIVGSGSPLIARVAATEFSTRLKTYSNETAESCRTSMATIGGQFFAEILSFCVRTS